MGLIARSSIYLESMFTVHDSSKINTALKIACESIVDTRKGRHWEITYGSQEASTFTIHVHNTAEYFREKEDEMAELGLTPHDTPEMIAIISALGREIDKENCQAITDLISAEFNCVTQDAALVS